MDALQKAIEQRNELIDGVKQGLEGVRHDIGQVKYDLNAAVVDSRRLEGLIAVI